MTGVFGAVDGTGLIATLAVLLACAVLGSMIGNRKHRLPGTDLMVGIGAAGGILTLCAAVTRLPVSLCMAALGVAAGAAGVVVLWRRMVPGGWMFWLALAMVLPLLLIGAAAPAILWDDFFHWLPNAAYLFRHDLLARPDLPATFSRVPGYPPAMPFLVVASSHLAGQFLENAGSMVNMVLLASFGAIMAGGVAALRPETDPLQIAGRVGLVGGGVAFGVATFVSVDVHEAFNQSVAFASYADVATAVAVAACALLGLLVLERLGEGREDEARTLAVRFGFVAVGLISFKQANPVLLALLLGGFGLILLRDPRLRLVPALRLAPWLLVPALLVYGVWRHYVRNNLVNGELGFRSIDQWSFSAIPGMANSILHYIAIAPYFHLMMLVVTVLGIMGLWRARDAADRLLAVTALAWIGYNAFLILVYLGAMTEEEAGWAADYWRYTPHLALLGLTALVVRATAMRWPRWLAGAVLAGAVASVVVVPIAVIAAGDRVAPQSRSWPVYVRMVGRAVADRLPPGARVVIHGGDNVNSAYHSLSYDILRLARDDRNLRPHIIWFGTLADDMIREAEEAGATHLLVTDVLGPVDAAVRAFGLPGLDHEIALFARTESGWEKIGSWPALPCQRPRASCVVAG